VEPIERATHERRVRRVEWRTQRHATTLRRRALRATDALIDSIEEINLGDRGRERDEQVQKRVRALENEVSRSAPDAVRRARTWLALHGALLDWQEQLLDEASPLRRTVAGDDDVFGGQIAWRLAS